MEDVETVGQLHRSRILTYPPGWVNQMVGRRACRMASNISGNVDTVCRLGWTAANGRGGCFAVTAQN